jgi:predicted DNA-binding protein
MVFNLDYEQAEKLDRLSERLGLPKSVLVRDAVNQLFEKYKQELAEETETRERPHAEDPQRGRR